MSLKRLIAALLCAAVVFGLIGCGSSNIEPEVSQNENAFYVKPVDGYETVAGKESGAATPISYNNATIGSFDAESGRLVIDNCVEIPRLEDYVKDGKTKARTLVIEGNVETIGESAFRGWTALETVTIGESVLTIDDDAFYGCTNLNKVSLGENTGIIGNDVFNGCGALTRVTLGSQVKSIGSDAFKNCAITDFTTGSDIQDNLCTGWTTLQTVVLEDTVHRIGKNAFNGCTSLVSVKLSNTLTKIGSYAFSGCQKLQDLWLPKSLTSIGAYYLQGTSLTHVYFEGTQREWSTLTRSSEKGWDKGAQYPGKTKPEYNQYGTNDFGKTRE